VVVMPRLALTGLQSLTSSENPISLKPLVIHPSPIHTYTFRSLDLPSLQPTNHSSSSKSEPSNQASEGK